jgi:hypothetical protein
MPPLDNTSQFRWLISSGLRFAAPLLFAKYGWQLTEAQIGDIGNWIVTAGLFAVSLYTSIKGRQQLLNTEPPKQ